MSSRVPFRLLTVSGLILAAALVYVIRPRFQTGREEGGPKEQPANRGPSPAPVQHPPQDSSEVPPQPAFLWSSLESEDYRQYLTNLVAVGCPKQIRTDIVLAEILRFYRPREAPWREKIALLQAEEDQNGATLDAPLGRERFRLRQELRVMELEKQKVIRELLGIVIPLEPIRAWHPRSYERYEAALASLPPGKRERAREVIESYWAASDELNDRHQLQRTPEYLEAYQKLNVDRKARLAQVLTPSELEDYEMKTTGIASRLSAELAGVGVSEDEFREIYRAKSALEAPFGGSVRVDMTEQGETPEHQQARERMENQLGTLLGAERFETWKLSRNPGFQVLADLGQRFGLPPESLREAFQVTQGASLDPTRFRGLPENDAVTVRLRELLGDEALTAWQRREKRSQLEFVLPP